MATSSAAALRRQIAEHRPDPLYLIVGDDDAETTRLGGEFVGLVEEDLRAFNVERVYATDKGVTPASMVQSARQLPMLGDRRVVVVLRAEKILKPKRRGRGEDVVEDADDDEPAGPSDALEQYVASPESSSVLVFVATDVDRTRRLFKQLQKTATIIECWGLKDGRDKVHLPSATKRAEEMVKQRASEAGQRIEAAAARLVADRAGADITTLRNDLDRLMLYAAGQKVITLQDAQAIVSAETSQDDWAVTNAIRDGRPGEALRQLGLALEGGAVPYMVLGQLAYYVREKMVLTHPARVPAAVEALFRTDLDMKSAGGDLRVLLERLVVELCRVPESPVRAAWR